MTTGTVVELWRRDGVTIEEWRWGQAQCEELLRRGLGEVLRVCPFDPDRSVTVGDALSAADGAELIGIVLDDVSYWDPESWDALFAVLRSDPRIGATGPATNETSVSHQHVTPPFAYSTPSLLRRCVAEHRRLRKGEQAHTPRLDPFAFAVRRADLAALDSDLPLQDVPDVISAADRSLVVAVDEFVHRWSAVHAQPRPDLQARLPRDARRVLDVGCATGALGAELKRDWDGEVVGIEVDPGLAAIAATQLDKVVTADLEDLRPDLFGTEFDAIFCGDIIEHFRDPWRAVGTLAGWLRPGGRFIATVPNAGHWSIIADLLHGQFDYVPFGLLCWSHIRFFTAGGARHLFESNHLVIEELAECDPDDSPPADEFVKAMRRLRREISVDRLRARKISIVARKDG